MLQSDQGLFKWPFVKKQLFCFFFIFFILYIFLNPDGVIPYSFYLNKLYIQCFANPMAWFAKDILHIVGPRVNFNNGTADTVFGYLSVLFIFFVAILGSFVWLIIGRGTPNYQKLYDILIVVLRYYLAITIIAYGSMKLIKIQFLPLSPVMLLQTYGGSTPADLGWSFMGYAPIYNYLIGFTEYAAGLLLLFRRTSTLGGLIAMVILVNVIAFDYSFDVNVKMLSTVLTAMTLFLLSKDIVRLVNFFFLNKIVYPEAGPAPYFKKEWKNTALSITKCLFIFCIVFLDLRENIARTKQDPFNTQKQPLYGIYNVTGFIRNKDILKPLTTDTFRWKKLIISTPPGNASIMFMDDSLRNFVFKADTVKHKIVLYAKKDTLDKYTFIYNQTHDSTLILHGKWHKDSLEIKFKEYDINKFPLINIGFRWIKDRHFKNKK